jgi:hypothetical protein
LPHFGAGVFIDRHATCHYHKLQVEVNPTPYALETRAKAIKQPRGRSFYGRSTTQPKKWSPFERG